MLVPFAGYILKLYLLLFIISDYEPQFVAEKQASFDSSSIARIMHLANSISPVIYAKNQFFHLLSTSKRSCFSF